MPKKPKTPSSDAAVGGYLRISQIKWPPGCVTPEERRAHVEELKRLRMSELINDAASCGEVITRWYDDMGVSGRGEFLEKRTDFERARQDAASGGLRVLFARDLSRLFRDLMDQELWFAEMQAVGCDIRIQDLPYVADAATRTLIRQQIGAFNQYIAGRYAAVLRGILREKVASGKWVGRQKPMWGLTYDTALKGYRLNPLTQDCICFLYETFVECGGVGGQTARVMNRHWDEGHPRATLTPEGARWTSETVLQLTRRTVYRRMTQYTDIKTYVPDLIPEVVPVELAAEVDRLLALRGPVNAETHARIKAGRLDYTYGPLLRCDVCGGRLRAYCYPDNWKSAGVPLRSLSWVCVRARRFSRECNASGSIQQFRLDALVAAGVEQAFALYRQAFAAPPSKNARGKNPKKEGDGLGLKDTLERTLASLASQRQRCVDMFRAGILRDMDELQREVAKVDAEEARIRAQIAGVQTEGAQGLEDALPPLPRLSPAEWSRLQSQYALVFRESVLQPLDLPKHDFLRSLGAMIHVRQFPREPLQRKTGNHLRYSGRLVIVLEMQTLGLVGPRALTLAETDDAIAEVWKRRSEAAQATRWPGKQEE